jgi:hypothetical protein
LIQTKVKRQIKTLLLYHLSFLHAMMKFKDIDKKVAISETGDQKGSFIQQTQYFIQDSRSSGNQCFSGPNWFLPNLSVGPACLGISGRSNIYQFYSSKLFYCIIYRSSMLWWSSRTFTKLKSQSQKCFNERKYQYLKYKKLYIYFSEHCLLKQVCFEVNIL